MTHHRINSLQASDQTEALHERRIYPRTPFPFTASRSSLPDIAESSEHTDEMEGGSGGGTSPQINQKDLVLEPEILSPVKTPLAASVRPSAGNEDSDDYSKLSEEPPALISDPTVLSAKRSASSCSSDGSDLLAELLKYENSPRDLSVEEARFIRDYHCGSSAHKDRQNNSQENPASLVPSKKRGCPGPSTLCKSTWSVFVVSKTEL